MGRLIDKFRVGQTLTFQGESVPQGVFLRTPGGGGSIPITTPSTKVYKVLEVIEAHGQIIVEEVPKKG